MSTAAPNNCVERTGTSRLAHLQFLWWVHRFALLERLMFWLYERITHKRHPNA